MINQLDAITEVEQILSSHWTYSVLPAERRLLRATQRLEVQIAQQAQPEERPDVMTLKDVLIYLLAMLLLLAVLGRLA